MEEKRIAGNCRNFDTINASIIQQTLYLNNAPLNGFDNAAIYLSKK